MLLPPMLLEFQKLPWNFKRSFKRLAIVVVNREKDVVTLFLTSFIFKLFFFH